MHGFINQRIVYCQNLHHLHKAYHISPRNKDQKLVCRLFKMHGIFTLLSQCNARKIWPLKINFGLPNAEIGQKMANGQCYF